MALIIPDFNKASRDAGGGGQSLGAFAAYRAICRKVREDKERRKQLLRRYELEHSRYLQQFGVFGFESSVPSGLTLPSLRLPLPGTFDRQIGNDEFITFEDRQFS